jgi:HK97 family phage prohead protease/HK97 family phage major capsid protein
MEKILHMASTFKSHENDDGSVMIRGMASTNHSDRAGDVIAAEAWGKGGLENFKNNPVILFNHDYDKPIGRATGIKVTDSGLELEAKISKSAPAAVCELVKDGVLGAFSVGFKVKDADYIKETDGLMIKDAELFEVSVVSVPCNQAATFSLAKSFDSEDEYNEFKKTFTNRVDLAGQSLAKDEDTSSNIASDTPQSVEKSTDQEIKMENNTSSIDLEAFAKQVADETAAKIAMKQAETKAAEQAEAKAAQEAADAKALEANSIKSSIQTGIETGVEKLQSDLQKEFEAKNADHAAIVAKYQADLEEKGAELEAMRNSKRDFSGRKGAEVSDFAKEFLGAHILGKVTGKGMDTDYGRELLEKAGGGVTPTGDVTISLDTTVATQFEEEVKLEQKVAGLFREIAVSGGATVLPINPDAEAATFAASAPAGNLEDNTNGTANNANAYNVGQVILKPHRLISSTNLSNDTDEKTLVSLLPMLQNAMARAHARAKDKMCLFGNGTPSISGLVGGDGTDGGAGLVSADVSAAGGLAVGDFDISDNDLLTSANLIKARSQMGKYGLNSADLAVIVSPLGYMELMQDAAFADVSQVGDLSMKASGVVGSIYGMPVVVSDLLTKADDTTSFAMVNTRNYVIPRLRGVSIESDYSVTNQRTDLVASQSIGFAELVAGYALNFPAVHAIHQA